MDEETKEEQEQYPRDGVGDIDGGMDMEGLFEQAIKIKESRNSVFRRRYDFWPSFYQHSLFSREVGKWLFLFSNLERIHYHTHF